MIDYGKEFHNALVKAGVNAVRGDYKAPAKTPSVSYMEMLNSDRVKGDNIKYSNISYTLSIWGSDVAEIVETTEKVDNALQPLGFSRSGGNEFWIDGLCQKIYQYTAIGCEIK